MAKTELLYPKNVGRGVINCKAGKHLPYTNFETIRNGPTNYLLTTIITFIWTCLFSYLSQILSFERIASNF